MTDIGPAVRRITLLTDFGTRDGYVAAMRGIIAGIAPEAAVEDATHEIEPGDVQAGAWALAMYAMYYPPGTIHVAVVDPGVGSARRAIAARAGGQIFVAPDNGVLTRVLEADSEIVEIQEPAYRRATVSPTFHGRDIFAPAAAHIARGISLDQLGPRALGIIRLEMPQPVRSAAVSDRNANSEMSGSNAERAERPEPAEPLITGDVIHVDRFGNLITNIPAAWLPDLDDAHTIEVHAGDYVVRFGKSYGVVESGVPIAYVGSARTLEIGIRDKSVAAVTGMKRGARVTVHHTGAASSNIS